MSSSKGKSYAEKLGGKARVKSVSAVSDPSSAAAGSSPGPLHLEQAPHQPSSLTNNSNSASFNSPIHLISVSSSLAASVTSCGSSQHDAMASCGLPANNGDTSTPASCGSQGLGINNNPTVPASQGSQTPAVSSSDQQGMAEQHSPALTSEALRLAAHSDARDATAAQTLGFQQPAITSLASTLSSSSVTATVSAGPATLSSAAPFMAHSPWGVLHSQPPSQGLFAGPGFDSPFQGWQQAPWWFSPQLSPWQQPAPWGMAPHFAATQQGWPFTPTRQVSPHGTLVPQALASPHADPAQATHSQTPAAQDPVSQSSPSPSAFLPLSGRREGQSDSPRLSRDSLTPGPEGETSEEDQEEEPVSDQQHWSFSDSVSLLASWAPAAVGQKAESRAPCLSAAEVALGATPQPSSSHHSLKESQMVGEAMGRVHELVRGSCLMPEVPAGSVPDFPGAMPCGRFLKPERLPFSRGPPLSHRAIPESSLALSQEDLLLLPEKSRSSLRYASLTERTLSEWEETSRRGLESISIMDSFLGGLVEALKDPAPDSSSGDGLQIRKDPDPAVIFAFIRTVAQGLRYSADSFARLHMNAVLARRDSVLLASAITQSAASRASLRALPVKAGSLFGQHVQATIKSQADIRRDLAMNEGPSRKPAKRGAGGFTHSSPRPAKARRDAKQPGARSRPRPQRGGRQGNRPMVSKPGSPRPSHPQ